MTPLLLQWLLERTRDRHLIAATGGEILVFSKTVSAAGALSEESLKPARSGGGGGGWEFLVAMRTGRGGGEEVPPGGAVEEEAEMDGSFDPVLERKGGKHGWYGWEVGEEERGGEERKK